MRGIFFDGGQFLAPEACLILTQPIEQARQVLRDLDQEPAESCDGVVEPPPLLRIVLSKIQESDPLFRPDLRQSKHLERSCDPAYRESG
jgi:hypothetical protein